MASIFGAISVETPKYNLIKRLAARIEIRYLYVCRREMGLLNVFGGQTQMSVVTFTVPHMGQHGVP